MLGRKSKLSKRNKRTIYKMCIRTVMTYASPVFAHAAPKALHRLQDASKRFFDIAGSYPMRPFARRLTINRCIPPTLSFGYERHRPKLPYSTRPPVTASGRQEGREPTRDGFLRHPMPRRLPSGVVHSACHASSALACVVRPHSLADDPISCLRDISELDATRLSGGPDRHRRYYRMVGSRGFPIGCRSRHASFRTSAGVSYHIRPELLNKITRKALTMKKNFRNIYKTPQPLFMTPLQRARRALSRALEKAAENLLMRDSKNYLYNINFDGEDDDNFCDDEESEEFEWNLENTMKMNNHIETPDPALDKSNASFQYLSKKGRRLSDAKIKEGVFDGPQIRFLMADENFDATMNNTELDAWLTFKDVVNHFFPKMVDKNDYFLITNKLTIKIRFTCGFFPDNLGDYSEEWRERSYQDIKTMEKNTKVDGMQQHRPCSHSLVDYNVDLTQKDGSENYTMQFLSMPDLDPVPINENQRVRQTDELKVNHELTNDNLENNENDMNTLNCVLPSISNDQNEDVSMTEEENITDHYHGEWEQMFHDLITNKSTAQESTSEFKDLYSQISKTIDLLNT
ncbi:hypothetical protein EVAR_50752_1 [Eumeta japonica]|uniref:Uncharacterized protein n=1 Tax=Eumeta variegata TaxID=151549 RepID=A0A4C1Y3P8_EUMVA|nr:hypothetical protein EVAR_50752_1 [Eumeta japonica]